MNKALHRKCSKVDSESLLKQAKVMAVLGENT
jgi:hypothetical protein